jgi:phosphohistidine phosphatase
MFIYILRHGDASSEARYKDTERPLTDIGKLQATHVGKFLQQQKIHIETLLASPMKRAQQTASIVGQKLQTNSVTTTDFLLNGAGFISLIELLNQLHSRSVLLVGHIPHLVGALSFLLSDKNNREIELGKCSLAIVESLSPIEPGHATLRQLIHIDSISKHIRV